MRAKGKRAIPLCRSEFLQNITIALGGSSLKSLRYSNSILNFDIVEEEVEGSSMERLNIEAGDVSGRLTKLALWEDGYSWVFYRERKNSDGRQRTMEINAQLVGLDAIALATLIRMTLKDAWSMEAKWRNYSCP